MPTSTQCHLEGAAQTRRHNIAVSSMVFRIVYHPRDDVGIVPYRKTAMKPLRC